MKIVDLSLEIHSDMHVFPTYPKPASIKWCKREVHEFDAELILLSTHTGTHVDAPYHFVEGTRKIHELPIEMFVKDAVLLDLTDVRPRQYVGPPELGKAEEKVGGIRNGEAVLLHTGWSDNHLLLPDYLTDNPALSEEGSKYLASKSPSIVGIDCANIDHPDDPKFPVHKTLLADDILVVENLYNLKSLQTTRFKLFVLPLKLREGTGSPVRAVAVIE